MFFKSAITFALIAASAVTVESTSSAASSSSNSSSTQVQVQVVQVSDSNGSLSFFPNNIQAAAGSMVQFQFYPKNHTVTQSSFDDPCTRLTETTPNTTTFVNSGFMPTSENATEVPVFTMLINDTKPIWMYCAQTGHCEAGMVLAINANESSTSTFAAFQAKALASASTTTNSSTSSGTSSGSTSSSSSTSSSVTSPSASTTAATTSLASRPIVGYAAMALLFVAGFACML